MFSTHIYQLISFLTLKTKPLTSCIKKFLTLPVRISEWPKSEKTGRSHYIFRQLAKSNQICNNNEKYKSKIWSSFLMHKYLVTMLRSPHSTFYRRLQTLSNPMKRAFFHYKWNLLPSTDQFKASPQVITQLMLPPHY